VVFQRLAGILYQTGQLDEAGKLLAQLPRRLSEANEMSSMAMAVSLKRDDFDRAIVMAKRWIERKPRDPIAYLWLGQAQLAARRTDEAEAAFRQAPTVAPKDVRSWQGLFSYFVMSKQPDAARTTLTEWERNVEMPPVQKAYLLGQAYASLADYKEASTRFRDAYSRSPDLYGPLVAALVSDGKVDQAMQVCREVIASHPGSQPATVLAFALVNHGSASSDCQAAEPILREAINQYPDDPQLLLAVSGVRYLEGRLDDVVELSRRLLKRDSKNVTAMNNLSSILGEQSNHWSEAEEIIDRAIQIDGRTATLLDTKAMILLHSGRAEAAGQCLDEALAQSDRDPRYRFHRALVDQRLHQLERARDHLADARAAGLASSMLSPLERKLLADLEQFVGATEARATEPPRDARSPGSRGS
jgi:tetratricopeptide (TPR) repeat protein